MNPLIEQLKDAAQVLPGFNDEMVRLSDAIAIVCAHEAAKVSGQPVECTLLGVLADIRQKTGVGDKVMLSELADILAALIQNGDSAIDTNKRLTEKLLKRESAQAVEVSKEEFEAWWAKISKPIKGHVLPQLGDKELAFMGWNARAMMRESGWQPIETLPKTHGGRYSDYIFLAELKDCHWRIGKGCWVGDAFIEHGVGPIKPSHWMRLTPPDISREG